MLFEDVNKAEFTLLVFDCPAPDADPDPDPDPDEVDLPESKLSGALADVSGALAGELTMLEDEALLDCALGCSTAELTTAATLSFSFFVFVALSSAI